MYLERAAARGARVDGKVSRFHYLRNDERAVHTPPRYRLTASVRYVRSSYLIACVVAIALSNILRAYGAHQLYGG